MTHKTPERTTLNTEEDRIICNQTNLLKSDWTKYHPLKETCRNVASFHVSAYFTTVGHVSLFIQCI